MQVLFLNVEEGYCFILVFFFKVFLIFVKDFSYFSVSGTDFMAFCLVLMSHFRWGVLAP